MLRQEARLIGEQRDSAATVLRASRRALRSRGLQVLLGTVAFSGMAFGQAYWQFELVRNGQAGDFHILIGELLTSAITPVPAGGDFTQPQFADFFTNGTWSSGVSATGTGLVTNNGAQNYAVTALGGWGANTYACSSSPCALDAAPPQPTSGRNAFISALNFDWTDASGRSYRVTGTGVSGSNTFSLALIDSIGGNVITNYGANYSIVWQVNDQTNGRFNQTSWIETGYGPTVVPEINGSALPKAALLLICLFLLGRTRQCS